MRSATFVCRGAGTTLAVLATVVGAGAAAGCVSDRPTAPEPPTVGAEVSIADFAFAPASLSAKTGTVVRWTNTDDATHTVSADENVFDSGNLAKGKTFELTAGEPGTYTYFCRIHPFMKGTLVVTP